MKVLILGGTSFFGRDIARFFHEAGHQIALFTRGKEKPADLPPHRHFKGDRDRRADLEHAAAADKWDLVIDNIAYHAKHVEDALAAFATVKRYLLTSTVSVYRFVRERYPQPLQESSVDHDWRPEHELPNDVHWKYARGKLEAERVVIRQKKIPYTILRPPVVYGPHDVTDRGFWYVGRLLQGGPILLSGDGSNSFRMVYSVDCAKAYLQAATTDRTLGRCYNISQGEIITLKNFIDESAFALGIQPQYVNVPAELLGDLGGPYATPIMVNLVQDNTAAERDFGYKTTPWADFAALSAHWFRDKWKGDATKLYATRSEELLLAQAWQEATARFRAI